MPRAGTSRSSRACARARSASERILDAFARVPRHQFLPGVSAKVAYTDDAIVTHDVGGVPTSSSSQPSLMARMLEQLDLRAGDRVLEIGTGTGYNAALMAELGAAVTTVELQPEVAAAAREHLRAVGIPATGDATAADAPADRGAARSPPPGSVRVITGDGAAPPDGPYERIIVTAGCWSLPAAVVEALADGGVLVAPLRVNGVELVLGLRREGDVLTGGSAIPCGFMPMRGGDERPWRWELGGGGVATADADLGVEGRGALDRLLAEPGRPVGDPLALREREQPLGAILWLGLQGDPLLAPYRTNAVKHFRFEVVRGKQRIHKSPARWQRGRVPAVAAGGAGCRAPHRRRAARCDRRSGGLRTELPASGARVVVGSTGRRSSRACGPVPCTRPSTQHPSCAPGRVRRRSTRSSRTSSWRRRPFRRLATMPSEAGHRTLTGKSGEVPLPHDRWRRPSAALPWR